MLRELTAVNSKCLGPLWICYFHLRSWLSVMSSPSAPLTLSGAVRNAVRARHYSLATERAYVHWIKRFVVFHGRRHPRDLGASEVSSFLSWLANVGHVAAATQNQALAALLFLYRQVLGLDLPWLHDVIRAKKPKRLPNVLTQDECRPLLDKVDSEHALMARLMYGSGMRISECLSLRVKDVDIGLRQIARGSASRFPRTPCATPLPLT